MPKSESIGHSWRPLARALTSGIALLLLVTGCATDAPPQVETPAVTPTTRTTEATTVPEETPEPQAITTDPKLPAIPEPPVLPDAAKENTEEGALAFAEYWRGVLVYTHLSGTTAQLHEISDDTCKYCNLLVQERIQYNKEAKIIHEYGLEYNRPPKVMEESDNFFLIAIDATQHSYLVSADPLIGNTDDPLRFEEQDQLGGLALSWVDGAWRVYGYGPVQP